MEPVNTHFLYPSTLLVSRDPYLVTTILGSCVSICMYDQVLKFGGINHYMLPFWNGEGLASPKYGNIAIEKLFQRMLELGSQKKNIIAKVFGGGEVIETNIKNFHIGERNIQIAYDMLSDLKIPIVGASTGGKNGRKIQFENQTGIVRQKFIENSHIQKTTENGT